MMMLATVLLVTADRSCCWLTAGDDDARVDHPSVVGQEPNAPLQDRGADAGLTHEPASALIRGAAACFTSPTLRYRRQPNFHRAR